VNNKVAPGISTFTPNFSLTVAQVYLGLVDKSFQSYSSFFILKGKALPGIVVRRIKDLLKDIIT
jgi:hypothetical protein